MCSKRFSLLLASRSICNHIYATVPLKQEPEYYILAIKLIQQQGSKSCFFPSASTATILACCAPSSLSCALVRGGVYKGERHITLRSCIGPTLPPTWPLSPTRRLARTHCSWVVLHPTHDYRYPNGLDPSNGPRHSSKKHGSGPAQLDGHRASVGTRHYYYIRSCLGRQVTP
jgi:hypothetical protein